VTNKLGLVVSISRMFATKMNKRKILAGRLLKQNIFENIMKYFKYPTRPAGAGGNIRPAKAYF